MDKTASKNPRNKKQIIIAAALAVLGFPAIFLLSGHLCVTRTKSLKQRIFLIQKPSSTELQQLRRGDYVRFDKHHPWSEETGGKSSMLKQVGCGPGDELSVSLLNAYFCNGEFLGIALTEDSKGKPLPRFEFNGVVPPDSLFVVGHHPRSFDSRYFGFVKLSEVTEIAYPLF